MKNKLKELRRKHNLSQAEIANILNITQASYSHYETNRRQPDLQTLITLADFYKITLDEIVSHEVPYLINKSEFSADQLAVIDLVKRLDNEQVKNLIAYIKGLQDGKR